MKISKSYDSQSDVPAMFKEAYTEQDGKFVLTGDIEVKTQEDVDKVLGAKKHIDAELTTVKEQLKAESQKALEAVSRNEVLELQIKDGADPAKLQELVDTKIKVATEELTKQLTEANEKNTSFQNTIYGAEKEKIVNGIVGSFSENVKDEASYILKDIFERAEDGSYVTKSAFGLDAGLSAEQATAKLTELRPAWMKQNTGGQGTGAQGAGATDDRAKFNELLKKRQSGETLNRQEAVELSTIANQLKNEE